MYWSTAVIAGRLAVDLGEVDAAEEERRPAGLEARACSMLADQRGRGVRRAVGEDDILAQVEGPGQTVRAQLPAFGQTGLQLELVVVLDQRLPDLEAGVGVPEVFLAVDQIAVDADRDLLRYRRGVSPSPSWMYDGSGSSWANARVRLGATTAEPETRAAAWSGLGPRRRDGYGANGSGHGVCSLH